MKRFIIIACAVVLFAFSWNLLYYRMGFYLDLHPNAPVTTFMKTDETTIYMEKDGTFVPFEIRGVDMGAGIPGKWATDFAIEKETYLRWFAQIQELGANTIRVYTILHDDFYNAFYEYNSQREREGKEPLYLLHGVWVNDYIQFSHRDAFDDEFRQTFLDDCRTLVDVLHGKKSLSLSYGNIGSGSYRRDVSRWVIGYILGVEWEGYTVVYTDQNCTQRAGYAGTYLYTAPEASPFESMLAEVGDKIIEYESERYKQQRLVAFANWPTTDPFVYPLTIMAAGLKVGIVDVEHIHQTEAFLSGMFASYHIYSYYPDYLDQMREFEQYSDEEIIERLGEVRRANIEYRISLLKGPKIEDYLTPENYVDSYGHYNTYLAYLKALAAYHTIPVVISEYGVTTGRGMAQIDRNTGRNQGHMSEREQGQAIIDCYQDIMAAGCAGSCVFTWQDEWFKRTWNTMHAVDLSNTAYWSDYQTNEQFFGLLAFDPGKEKSVCYVDGDLSEWTEDDLVSENAGMEVSMKYDEKFLYFLLYKDGFDEGAETLYVPLDITPKTGSTYCEEYDVPFERACDFLMVIDGRENSRVLVQERYEVLRAIYWHQYYVLNPYFEENTPESDSPVFVPINMALKLEGLLPETDTTIPTGESFETGKLRYGNANPEDPAFDSLADFIFSGDYVEIRIPWELLNFSNPSDMTVHDDYYECYGIEDMRIDELYVGIGSADDAGRRIPMGVLPLKAWGKKVTYHERLKQSYYMLRDYWASLDQGHS